MSTRLVVVACMVMAGTALAGCSSGGGGADGASTEDEKQGLPARTLPWGLTDCRFAVAIVAAPGALVNQFLPAGFRSLGMAEIASPGAPNPTAEGNLGLELFSCASGLDHNGSEVAGMQYASYFSAVEPPAALREDVTYHFVKWDVLVPDIERRALLLQYGIKASGGSVEFSQGRDDGAFALHAGSLAWDGRGADTFVGSSALEQTDGSFIEFTATPGGLATWRTNFTWSGGGLGPQLVVPGSGGFAATILGTQPKQGVGYSGRASFTGGSLFLPEQPAELPPAPELPTKPPRGW